MQHGEQRNEEAMEGTELLAALGDYDQSALDLHADCQAFAAVANQNNLENIEVATESAIRGFSLLVEAVDEHVKDGAERLSMLSSLMLLQDKQRLHHLVLLSGNPDIASFDKYYKQGLHKQLIYMANHAPNEPEFKHQLRELYSNVLCEQIEDFTVRARENYGTRTHYFAGYAKNVGSCILRCFVTGFTHHNPWAIPSIHPRPTKRRSAEGTEGQTP